jgi:hypothetical protein
MPKVTGMLRLSDSKPLLWETPLFIDVNRADANEPLLINAA